MARAARRRQAQDALDFERDRERMLVEQLEEVMAESTGARVDEAALSTIDADAAALVRSILDPQEPRADDELEEAFYEPEPDEPEPAEVLEEEIGRLGQVIEECRLKQRALEHYLTALEAPLEA
jgi:hypothetical protein